MYMTTIRNFIATQISEGTPPDKVFAKFRQEYQDRLPEISAMLPGSGKNKQTVSQYITEQASQLATEQEFLGQTELGKRFLDLALRRMRFVADVIPTLERAITEIEQRDPGTDALVIEQQFAKVRSLSNMIEAIDRGDTKQVGEALRAALDYLPEPQQQLAAELYPQQVPLR